MNPIILTRIVVTLGIALCGFVGGVAVTRNHYLPTIAQKDLALVQERLTWAQAVNAGQKEVEKAVADKAALITQLEINHEQANKALNVLLDSPAVGVRLPATCMPAASGGEVPASGRSAVQTAAAERTGDPYQEALDRVKREMDADALEWRDAIEACRVMQGFLNGGSQ